MELSFRVVLTLEIEIITLKVNGKNHECKDLKICNQAKSKTWYANSCLLLLELTLGYIHGQCRDQPLPD